MCGINIYIHANQKKGSDIVANMNHANRFRGPDHNSNIEIQGNECAWNIGFNRLAINDLSNNGNQPLYSADKRYLLVFNGELYNFIELKKKYLSDISFQSTSDAEVFLYLLINYKIDKLKECRGMYAFFFLDTQTGTALCGRDQSGIKPLFFYIANQTCLISSDIHGIRASGIADSTINASAIPHYLWFKYFPVQQTIYKNIHPVLPGQVIEFKTFQLQQSYKIEEHTHPHVNKENFFDDFVSVMDLYTSSDASGGLMLSGGIDSSLIAAALHKLNKNIPAFAIVHNDAASTKARLKLCEKNYHSTIQYINIGPDILDNVPDYIQALDQPIADPAGLLTMQIAKESKSVKYLLSGAGADECFGGYNRHRAMYYFIKYPILFKLIKHLPNIRYTSNTKGDSLGRRLQKLKRAAQESPLPFFFASSSLDWEFQQNPGWIDDLPKLNTVQEALQFDETNYLIGDLFEMNDRCGMYYSKEIRVPFMDPLIRAYAIQEFQHSNNNFPDKKLLKEALIKTGGEALTKQSKEGFGFPVGLWLSQNKNGLLNTLDNIHPLILEWIDKKKIQWYISMLKSGKRDTSQEIFGIIVLNSWLHKNV